MMNLRHYLRIWLACLRYSMVRTMMFRGDFFVWALVELFLLRGTAGENRFGPDPLGGAQNMDRVFRGEVASRAAPSGVEQS